ncbi:sulfotransferase family protein [Nonomuraea pusilla]|uniref:Sulfotransferase family protein n=1 Tax=Nonomuraea pusilla TaxID=46177 RepID=A0A1H8HQY2_9ACTN|nr:sulfotransferase family protein [Nonomuraea pusilla]SEN58474.1 hypothetical protein SAMN05660976_07865 [Nonomuraea pusilla]
MLKVIGAGFPRTGTVSMKAALERLGFGPCYHMFEIMTDPSQVDRWLPAASGQPLDWNRVFDGYRSAQDWPASFFWREQAEAFPEAKVVLTVRDPSRWYVSMKALFADNPLRQAEGRELPEGAAAVAGTMARLSPVLAHIGRSTFGDDWTLDGGLPDERAAVEVFERHAAEVRASLPPERLLVFDVREGWGPLCAFLGVDVPGEPFPHLNDSAAIRRTFDTLMTEGTLPSPFVPGGGA